MQFPRKQRKRMQKTYPGDKLSSATRFDSRIIHDYSMKASMLEDFSWFFYPQPCLICGFAKESVGVLPFDLAPGGQSHHWLLRTHEGHSRRRRMEKLAMTGLSWILCPMEIYGKSMNITIFLMNWPLSNRHLKLSSIIRGHNTFQRFCGECRQIMVRMPYAIHGWCSFRPG